jgi:hypothetical protein
VNDDKAGCWSHGGKSSFPTNAEARHALKTVRRHTKRGAHIPVRTYLCHECKAWFLTSSSKEGRWV